MILIADKPKDLTELLSIDKANELINMMFKTLYINTKDLSIF
ncbi:MAG: hypothetical protein ACP5UN_00465 [Candidatus Micrarchaeia archaeon]